MQGYNPLVDSLVSAPAPAAPFDSNAGATMGAGMGPAPSQMGPHIADLQGTPPLTGDHNIPLHVGFLAIVALAVVIAFRVMGFRFSAVGKIGVGRG